MPLSGLSSSKIVEIWESAAILPLESLSSWVQGVVLMAKTNALPKSGGRKKGSKNKRTLMLEQAASQASANHQSGVDTIDELLKHEKSQAAFYQPFITLPDGQRVENKNHNMKVWLTLLQMVGDLAYKLAQFQTPKLTTTTVRTDPTSPMRVQVEWVN